MRNMLFWAIAVTVFMLPFSVTVAFAQDIYQDFNTGSTNIQQMYIDFLRNDGYKPEVDKDGDIVFRRNGKSYIIMIDPRDPQFFRLALPNVWEIENSNERATAYLAANESNHKSKVSKVVVTASNVWVNIEIFVARPEDFKGIFERALDALDNGLNNFVAEMRN